MGLLMTTVISIVEARPNQPIGIRHYPRFGGRRDALLICPRRILQVAAGVSLPAEANHHDALVHRDGEAARQGRKTCRA